MKTLQELGNLLETTGLPVTYRAWPEGNAPLLPYICYICTNSNNFIADGKVYVVGHHVRVELYTKEKEPDIEAKLEMALSEVAWEKSEEYIESEKCYQILYELEV